MDETRTPIPADVVREQLRATLLSTNRLQTLATHMESREVASTITALRTAIEALARHVGIDLDD